jgi:hypothetical protein
MKKIFFSKGSQHEKDSDPELRVWVVLPRHDSFVSSWFVQRVVNGNTGLADRMPFFGKLFFPSCSQRSLFLKQKAGTVPYSKAKDFFLFSRG